MRNPTKEERAVAADEAEERSLYTGEVLRKKELCQLYLVRTQCAGVLVGYVAEYDPKAHYLCLLDARQIWRWSGANTCFELANEGFATARISQLGAITYVNEPSALYRISSAVAKKFCPQWA